MRTKRAQVRVSLALEGGLRHLGQGWGLLYLRRVEETLDPVLEASEYSTKVLLDRLASLTQDDCSEVYSPQGLSLLSMLWTKVAAHERLMYQANWLGRPIIQLPSDVLILQEIIWETQPDVIVETGVAHGGSLVLAASILELMGKGRVVGIDVEIRPHNREAIATHPLSHRIDLIEGDSVAPATVDAVRAMIPSGARVMVALDSNHSADHVAKELAAYASLVTPGCYLVAHDGAQLWVWDNPNAAEHWSDDHPLIAIDAFLRDHPEFVCDESRTRFGITSSPHGYLLRQNSEAGAGA